MTRPFHMISEKCRCLNKGVVVCCAVFIMLMACLAGCASKENGENSESGINSVQNAVTVNDQTIETAFASIQIPSDCLGKIQHMEIAEGDVTMEVFSMLPEDGGRELFRICFGSTQMGTPIGLLMAGDEEIPVSVVTSEYDINTFSADEKEVYFGMMDQLNGIISSILEHENFKKIDEPQQVETVETTQTVGLTYWEVELPENMEWEESNIDGIYKVDFYGLFGGERIRLYTISLGEASAETALGAYTADGMTRTLGLEIHSIDKQIDWMGEEGMAIYGNMMDTINDVLQVIMGSENYIE